MKSRLFFTTLLLLGGVLSSPASPVDGPPKGVYFRTLGVGVNAADLFYQEDAKPKPATVDTERRSPYYEYKGGSAPLVFVRYTTGADGKKVAVPVAEIALDPAIKRALLIFSKTSGAGEKLAIVALSDDARAVPPGGYRFVNFLPIQAGVILGGKKQIIAPGISFISEAPAGTDRNVYPFKVYIITGDSAIPVYSNVWASDVRKRNLVLMVPAQESPSGVEIKYLSESVNAIPSEESESKPQP